VNIANGLDLGANAQANRPMTLSAPKPPEPDGEPFRFADPFRIDMPDAPGVPLILASPHSGTLYPACMRSALCVPLIDLRRTEDAFVDDLFRPGVGAGATLISANYARGFVDLNRAPGELDPAMFLDGPPRPCATPNPRVRAGLGCLPRVGAGGRAIYARGLRRADGERRLSEIHDVYHDGLSRLVAETRATHGVAFLIDCHSMPSIQPGRRKPAQIVLGDRYGTSCDPHIIGLAERLFRRLGYSVSRNAPYAGGYTTERYGDLRRGIHALQIELRRDLYMNEVRVMKSAGFGSLKRDLAQVCAELAEFAAREGRSGRLAG